MLQFMAFVSKNGMAITSNEAVIHPDESQGILLKIPSGKWFQFKKSWPKNSLNQINQFHENNFLNIFHKN